MRMYSFWSPVVELLGRLRMCSLVEEGLGLALRAKGLSHLSFLLVVQDVSPELPAPAAMPLLAQVSHHDRLSPLEPKLQ